MFVMSVAKALAALNCPGLVLGAVQRKTKALKHRIESHGVMPEPETITMNDLLLKLFGLMTNF